MNLDKASESALKKVPEQAKVDPPQITEQTTQQPPDTNQLEQTANFDTQPVNNQNETELVAQIE